MAIPGCAKPRQCVTPSVPANLASPQVRREELDGDLSRQARVLGRVDDPHAALAEFGADRIRAEGSVKLSPQVAE